MNEKELIKIIKTTLNSEYIGDDCAYLEDLGIVVSQDSLVEDVHFKLEFITPFQLGYKAVMVNISDICASGAEPKYLTIALSLPNYVDEKFVEEFYKGAKEASGDVKIVGGDLTGGEKVFISVTAIGATKNRKISSRSNAKVGYKILVSGEHGNSATGLKMLLNGSKLEQSSKFIKAHLMPVAQRKFSQKIATQITENYAMMDTSDGLADALIQIAKASKVRVKINTSKIPHDKNIDMQTVLYGGEDYQLVVAVPKDFLPQDTDLIEIGEITDGDIGLELDGEFYQDIDDKLFNHFREQNK